MLHAFTCTGRHLGNISAISTGLCELDRFLPAHACDKLRVPLETLMFHDCPGTEDLVFR